MRKRLIIQIRIVLTSPVIIRMKRLRLRLTSRTVTYLKNRWKRDMIRKRRLRSL